jgi:CRP-like cAMP-binding protein
VVNVVRPDLIRRNRLLAALPAADLALLTPHLKEVPLAARELLHETQDEIEHVYFPHSGMVSLFAVTDDGEAIETASIGAEGAVGASASLGIRRAYCRALVQVPGIASRIPVSHLQRAAAEGERIRDMLMRTHEILLMQAQQTAVCSALHGVEARLARWLLQTQDRTGSSAIPLIQEFLAQVLGVRRTTINLVIRTLHEAGLVRYRRGQIEIADRNGLRTESCNCYHVIRRQMEQIGEPAKD